MNGLETVSQKELDDIIMRHMRFSAGIPGGARAVLKFKDMSGLKFNQADLSQADFTGSKLFGADLSGGTFKGVSFFACDMRECNMEGANFSRADFRGAYVAGANLSGADMEHADLREGAVMERHSKGSLETLREENSFSMKPQKTIFAGAKLRETNLSKARASSADFSDADLSGVVMQDADFTDANLEGANLSKADLSGSKLRNANMRSTIMMGTVMNHVERSGLDLSEAVYEASVGNKVEELEKPLPDMLKDHTAWIATAGKEGTRLDLSGYDLRQVEDLTQYRFTAVKAVGTNFLHQDLQGVEMQSALLDRSDFRDCKLQKADFRGTSLKQAKLARADLSGANFGPLKFGNPDGSTFLNRVNLSQANLRYAVLNGANLSDALLNEADLSYAILIDCDLRRADLTGALLDGADLSGALLSDAILDERYR
jgi:uncharacterized protein YjbI with pentapeptide repeats